MINKASADLIKEFEGLRLTAYKCSAGVWTIGWGTTAAAGVGIEPKAGMKITQADAELYFQRGIDKFAAQIKPMLTRPANDNQFGAMVSLAYNIGPAAFKRSSVLRHFNAGNNAAAANAFLAWNKAGGKVLAGLVRRRAAEKALFEIPIAPSAPKIAAPAPSKPIAAPAAAPKPQGGLAGRILGLFGKV